MILHFMAMGFLNFLKTMMTFSSVNVLNNMLLDLQVIPFTFTAMSCSTFFRPWRKNLLDKDPSKRDFMVETTQVQTVTVMINIQVIIQRQVYKEPKRAVRIQTDIPLSCSYKSFFHLLN